MACTEHSVQEAIRKKGKKRKRSEHILSTGSMLQSLTQQTPSVGNEPPPIEVKKKRPLRSNTTNPFEDNPQGEFFYKNGITPKLGQPIGEDFNSSLKPRFNNRFETKPSIIGVVIEHADGTITSPEKPIKELPNYKSTKAGTPPEKGKQAKYRRDGDGNRVNEICVVRMGTKRTLFFSHPIQEEERRHPQGNILTDSLENRISSTADELEEITNQIDGTQNQDNNNGEQAIEKWILKLPSAPQNAIKVADVILNSTRLATWFYKSQNGRDKPQSAVMGVGAGEYVRFYKVKDTCHSGKSDFEWSHLIAHSFGGIDGQDPQVPENLVATTAGCNTWMMLAEDTVRHVLNNKEIKNVQVRVVAELVPGTHIAKWIDYTISWDNNKKLKFTFEGLRHDAPTSIFKQYFFALADAEMKHEDSTTVTQFDKPNNSIPTCSN